MHPFDFLLAEAAGSLGPLKGYRYPLLTFVIALAISWLLTPHVRTLAFRLGAVDDPKRDDRRVHTEPLPRWGGIAIFAGLAVSLMAVLPFAYPLYPFPKYVVGMLLVGAILVVFGALDDLFQYSAKVQLLVLLGAGTAIQFLADPVIGQIQIKTLGIPFGDGAFFELGMWAVPVTAIYIFVVTKTMDTIDGIDGLAAGIASISAMTLCILGIYGEQPRVALIAAAIAGGAMGFLRHNYNPAKIIMGTGGAYILGFSLACLSIVGAMKTAAAIALIMPLLVFGVPIFDAFQVIFKRLRSGSSIFQADKRHVHHALLARGLSQRQTVTVLYSIAALLCAIVIFLAVKRG